MQFDVIPIQPEATRRNRRIEEGVNRVLRSYDRVRSGLGMQGRKAPYDDDRYEFLGGPSDTLRKRHYDKSLRNLWKAEAHLPWSDFADCSAQERQLRDVAERALTSTESSAVARMRQGDFKAMLDREYTPAQKRAVVNILSLIGHGEAYAWLVSAEVLNEVKSTGARAALTMQVLEEAKHFVVLRELLLAFDMPIPRMCGWEYLLLERTYKSTGLEKLFGMNVVVEGFALSLFGLLAHLPGLEVLGLFHLDEARHTALPKNYFAEFPMTWWESHDPRAQLRRLSLVLPAVPVLLWIEEDLATLGIDACEFGGSLARKVLLLADRVGFKVGLSRGQLERLLDWSVNRYCKATRPGFVGRSFLTAETTRRPDAQAVEREVFGVGGLDAVPDLGAGPRPRA
jgi:hypothetical protein